MKKGLFITFEGGEACGKSTQIKLFKEYIQTRQDKDNFVFIREPGGTILSEKIRDLLLNFRQDAPTAKAELLLFLASRAHLYEKVLKPALEQGKIVVADRFYDSTVAYQGFARQIMPAQEILELNKMILNSLTPDLTFYLEIKPEIAFKRKGDDILDRMESEPLEFHQKVYEGYRFMAEKEKNRFAVIDATKSIEEIQSQIRQKACNLIEKYYKQR